MEEDKTMDLFILIFTEKIVDILRLLGFSEIFWCYNKIEIFFGKWLNTSEMPVSHSHHMYL